MRKLFLIPLLTLLCTVMAWGENVAKNVTTGTEYGSLKTAIEEAGDGDEIQMLADLDIAPADFIKIDTSLTLDMNGHYIALTATTQAAVQVNGSGIDVTIKNGTIKNAGAKYNTTSNTFGLFAYYYNSLTLDNVTITNATRGLQGVRNTTVLNNCTIDAFESGIYMAYANATLSINGGHIEGAKYGINVSATNATLSINGGHIKGATYGINVTKANATLSINGGYIEGATYGIMNQQNTSEININSGLIEGSDAAIVLYYGGTLTATGGTIQGTRYYGIWAYSSYASTVNISGNAQVFGPTNALKSQHANSNITIDGGTLNSNGTTILLNKGNLTISDNALITSAGNYGVSSDATNTTGNITINGGSIGTAENRIGYGIGMKAGTLTMNGGSVYAYAYGIASQGGTLIVNDGVNIDIAPTAEHLVNGAAIALVAPASTPINATVNGGTFNATGMAFTQTAGTATINGGTFNGDVRAVELIAASANATLTIENGSFASKHNTVAATSLAAEYTATLDIKGGTFVVTPDNISTPSTDAVTISGNTTDNSGERAAYPAIVNISGGTFSGGYAGVSLWGKGAVANISGGSIDANAFGICGNGTSQYNGTEIYITGGNITGDGAGIYHPQAGTLNIKGNPVITGHTAIQLCAGVGLTGSITGGRFEAYGEDNRATKTGDGLIPDGAALSIVNRSYPGGMPQFTIKGGVFLAQHQDAILAYTWSNNTDSEWADAANHLSAREGIFSSDPTPFVPGVGEEYLVTKLNPTPTVYNHDAVVYADLWQIGETPHDPAYDFTNEEAEYVEINATTATVSGNIVGTVYTLNEDQSSKKVEVAEDYTLIIKEDKTLNIGNGGLDLNARSQVVVEPGAVVTVGMNGITSNSSTDNLVLQANSEKQAALLIDPDVIQNTQPLATVILSTKARQKSANPWNYIWEYFASPVVQITSSNKPTNNFNSGVHGLFQGESEFITGVYTWGGNDWALVNSWTSLVPFKGYQLTNNSANGGVEYTFKGNLLGNKDGEYAFTSNGYGYFGNSYSAPIVISNFLSALDNAVYERTVWLYDAGADTYVSVNPLAARLGSAKYKDGTAIKEIRSLQAFILNKKADGANAPINYRDAIWNNPRINSLVSAAPARERDNDMQWMNIYVAANGNKEMVTLVEGEDFSDAFDNGADAGKYINNNSMNLYAATNDGEQAIVATDNLENTLLSFQAGNATEYTLTFENSNENYMLRDNVTGLTIAMIEGAEYSFTQAANSTAQARFEVIGVAKMPTSIENVEETAKKEGIYTLSGQYVGRDFTKLPAGVYVVNGVKIVK